MEHLRPLFHEEVVDLEGDVEIGEESFTRHQILHALARPAYDRAFEEWIEARKERLLEKADGLLDQYDNADRFAQLSRKYLTGNVRPFIGAGLAIRSGYPGWTDFLYRICDESHVSESEIAELLRTGRYDDAAQRLSVDLGNGLFNENVQSTFARQRAPDGVINYLPLLFPGSSVFTTNFDPLLETVYKSEGVAGFDRVVSGKSLPEVASLMQSGIRLLVKIHGDCEQVADRVLLKSEYDSAYGDPSSVGDFFSRVIFGGPLLFLGCSLCVDRTITAMRDVVKTHRVGVLPRHYAFMELKKTDDRVQRKKDLATANIFPIWYGEGDHDEALEALFLKLLDAE